MNYDTIVIGGGPAGLTAGLYASRAGLKCLLIEKGVFGGLITNAEHVENFPGFPQGISGMELGDRMREQATKYGLETAMAEATGVAVEGNRKVVTTTDGDFTAGALILAGGSQRQRLGVPGEAEFNGKGVSYCATCDGAFFREQPVIVVGGGDVAITEALHLAKLASSVTVIHRRDQLRATHILQSRAIGNPRIRFVWNSVVEAIEGDLFVTRVRLMNLKTQTKSIADTAGVFVSVGFRPETEFVKDIVMLDDTNVAGILAAGDIRHNSGRQAITAAGDGATAAIFAEKYLTER
jgi:thioredoxin reductase (NADPH)